MSWTNDNKETTTTTTTTRRVLKRENHLVKVRIDSSDATVPKGRVMARLYLVMMLA